MYKRREYILYAVSVLILIMFSIELSPHIPFIKYWGNEIVDAALLYFVVVILWHLTFKRYPPRFVPFTIAVFTGVITEIFQLLQYPFLGLPIGTYDPLDLLFFVVGGIIALIVDRIIEVKTNS